MPLEFNPLTPATLDRALDMMASLYGAEAGRHGRAHARGAVEWLMAHPEQGGVWLIEAEAAIAGYIVLTACCSLEFGGPFALLDELYFEPEWRGRGLGAEAIAFAERWARARGMEALRLEVAHANEPALRLYRRCGFAAHGRDLMTKWI